MSEQPVDVDATRIAPWKYAWWVVVGGLFGIGIIGILTIGLALIGLALVLLLVGVSTAALNNRSTVGLMGGLGVAPLYLAWLNRDGPGRVCTTTVDSISCAEQSNPWPFVVVGGAFVVGSIVVARLGSSGRSTGQSATPQSR